MMATPRLSSENEPLTVLVSNHAVLALEDDTLILSPSSITISPVMGKIEAISHEVLPRDRFPPNVNYIDCSPKLLLPGLVDTHVHLNEPGRTDWEGFWTGTRAAASGGVTTVIDMPLNSIPPTTTVDAFRLKLSAARGQCWVDVGFYGGLIPGNADQLKPMVEAGVCGFKAFLIDAGTDEFPAASPQDVALAMETLKDSATVLMFHAEMVDPEPRPLGKGTLAEKTADPTAYETFLDSRPASYEMRAVSEIISLAHIAPSLPLHIVHLSASQCILLLRAARARGMRITAETCFHYLGFSAEDIPKGDTRHKCCPPIRDYENRIRLWNELVAEDSCIKTVVSDHSPCRPELKLLPKHLRKGSGIPDLANDDEKKHAGDFMAAWGGITSVGLGLSILHTTAAIRHSHFRPVTIVDIVRLCCQAPAKQVGLAHRKGALKVGMDADICVFDDAEAWTLKEADMLWKNHTTSWEGRDFKGRVVETWLRGRKVYQWQHGMSEFVTDRPFGEPITERRRE